MDGKAAKRLFRWSRSDIWVAVGYRVWWWTIGFIVLVAVSGPGCGSSLVSSDVVDSGGNSPVDSGISPVDSGVGSTADSGCKPFLSQSGEDTGLDACANGNLQRRASIQCPWPTMSPVPVCTMSTCGSDAVCGGDGSAASPKGYCAEAHNLAGYCGCFSGCREDADCGPGLICECEVVPFGRCVPASCATNADCGAGFACVATVEGAAGGSCSATAFPPPTLFVCQTAADTCRGPTDCGDATAAGGLSVGPTCLYDGTQRACGVICAPPARR
jgi:hypothetical protein